jgi:hypothetical protein
MNEKVDDIGELLTESLQAVQSIIFLIDSRLRRNFLMSVDECKEELRSTKTEQFRMMPKTDLGENYNENENEKEG